MNNLISSLEEFVFENKNKSYGAYALRKDYSDNMSKGMLISFSLVTLFFASAYSYSKCLSENLAYTHNTIVELSNVVFEEKKKDIVPPKSKEVKASSPAPTKASTAFTSVNVVRDNTTVVENLSPIVDSLANTTISTVTIKGVAGGENILPTEIKTNAATGDGIKKEGNGKIKRDSIYTIVEFNPEFPGGLAELKKFLSDNIKYPSFARENNIEGRVTLKFVVSKNGEIESIKAVTKFGGGLEEEAIRVVKLMPKWKPGMVNKNKVNVSFVLPVSFKLNK